MEKLKKFGIPLLKIMLSFGIIAALAWWAIASGDNVFGVLSASLARPQTWLYFLAGTLCCGLAALTTILRWRILVCGLGIEFPLRDALRIGSIGYLFNLAPLGVIGGDAIKMVMLGKKHNITYTNAFASTLFDRLIGLYILFLVAVGAILITGSHLHEAMQSICYPLFIIAGGGTVAFVLLLLPFVTDGEWTKKIDTEKPLGKFLSNLLAAFRVYRRHPIILLKAILMSVVVHLLFATAMFCIAVAVFDPNYLGFGYHTSAYATAGVLKAIPLPAGPSEAAMEGVYVGIYGGITGMAFATGQGMVLYLSERLMSLAVASVGMVYYFTSRREVIEAEKEII